jgi:hypothetical protein
MSRLHVRLVITVVVAVTVAVVLYKSVPVGGRPGFGAGTTTAPSATPSAPPGQVGAVTRFTVVTASGAVVTIDSPTACLALVNPWLEQWCTDTVSFAPSSLPATTPANLYGPAGQAYQATMNAAFLWAVLHGDSSICSNAAVAAYVAAGSGLGPAPTVPTSPSNSAGHMPNGAKECLAGLAQVRASPSIRITDPSDSTGAASISVQLVSPKSFASPSPT